MIYFLLLFSLPLDLTAQSDTIIVKLDSLEYPFKLYPYQSKGLTPVRRKVSGKMGAGFIDSIRVGKHAICYDTMQYHLIVYAADTVKILQGDFYGTHSNGILVEYDNWGRIVFEGENRFNFPTKINSPHYSYGVGVNRIYTYKNTSPTQPKTTREIIYKEGSKKYVSRLYDKNGELITESKGKR